VWGYVQGIKETSDALEELLAEGRAPDVLELAEYALTAVEHSLEHVDDSDGGMGDVAARLQDLHLRACEQGTPDPVALAERLFARELDSGWDIFDQALLTYADVLGEAGAARYRELAHARWASVPALEPGEGSRERDGSRFRITRIMKALAEQAGDLSDQIAVRERDLESPYNFLQIAELCRSHEAHDRALEWAQRGMAEFPDSPDHRLRDFLVSEYRRRGRTAEAIEHTWAAFSARPALETYRELAIDAKALGEWEPRRTVALALLRDPHAEPDRHARRSPLYRRRGATEL
jgi:tetratricopeptide (TPR) repeat protein